MNPILPQNSDSPASEIVKARKRFHPSFDENASEEKGWGSVDEDLADEAIADTDTVSIAKPSRDDRRSRRHTVPRTHQSCEIKVGGNIWSALLADKSDGGFSVLTDRHDGLKLGKKVELHTNAGWFTVRIVYINKAARPQDAAPNSDTWFRLGMKKTRRFLLF